MRRLKTRPGLWSTSWISCSATRGAEKYEKYQQRFFRTSVQNATDRPAHVLPSRCDRGEWLFPAAGATSWGNRGARGQYSHGNGSERYLCHVDGRPQPYRYVRSEGRCLDARVPGAHKLRRPAVPPRIDAEPGEHHSGPGPGSLLARTRHGASAGANLGADRPQPGARTQPDRAAYRLGRRHGTRPSDGESDAARIRVAKCVQWPRRRIPASPRRAVLHQSHRRLELTLEFDTEINYNAPLGDGPTELNQFRWKAKQMMYNSAIDSVFSFD